MSVLKFVSATALEGLPWAIRASLGCCAAGIATALTYSIEPLRAFPLLLAFPTVILSAWFLGMSGGVFCALTEAVTISILLGFTIRRLAQQRAQIGMQELRGRLSLANAERLLAEERARASEALRDRDELLQIALQANGMGLWVWDRQKDTIHWSDEKYRMYGLEPRSIEPSSEEWLGFVHPEDLDGVKAAVRRTREGLEEQHHQYRVVWPDGSVRWLESQSRCQRDSAGQVTRVLGVLSDVTRRKQADEAMLRAEKLAVVGRLAASVAHEINNPLAAVANLLYLITLTDTTETGHAYARQALDELMRVSLITQQTLKFHRQTGTPKRTKLSELIEAVLTLFRGKTVAAGISVEVRPESEASILCLPSETQQIFANLMSNAVEAMPQGGRLVIRLQPSRDWRDRKMAGMRVTFCDSGVGMNRATMRCIFEPFFTTKTETGTGLGMWVVAQLLERQRGHVRLWSTQRKGQSGTAFSVFLPFGEVPAARVVSEKPELNAVV